MHTTSEAPLLFLVEKKFSKYKKPGKNVNNELRKFFRIILFETFRKENKFSKFNKNY